jgi:DNA mismatch endonuclease (patch repair protein)
MQSIRSEGGRADKQLGSLLWHRGLRYRRKSQLPGKPDLVFPSAKVVVFVDGDFWHGRYLEERIARGDFKRNAEYWISKLRRTIERDQRYTIELEKAGWRVIRVWESDVQRVPAAIVEEIAQLVTKSGGERNTSSFKS